MTPDRSIILIDVDLNIKIFQYIVRNYNKCHLMYLKSLNIINI